MRTLFRAAIGGVCGFLSRELAASRVRGTAARGPGESETRQRVFADDRPVFGAVRVTYDITAPAAVFRDQGEDFADYEVNLLLTFRDHNGTATEPRMQGFIDRGRAAAKAFFAGDALTRTIAVGDRGVFAGLRWLGGMVPPKMPYTIRFVASDGGRGLPLAPMRASGFARLAPPATRDQQPRPA